MTDGAAPTAGIYYISVITLDYQNKVTVLQQQYSNNYYSTGSYNVLD